MSLLKEKSKQETAAKAPEGSLVLFVGGRKIAGFLSGANPTSPKIAHHVVQKSAEGFENGLVTDLERASNSIEAVVRELLGGKEGEGTALTAYVVLSNSKLKTYTFSSSQYYQGNQRTITAQEIRSVVQQTRSVATLPLTEFVLQAVPQSFLVNDMAGVRNPLGLEAHRLGVELKMHTMNFEDFKNLSRAFEAAEIEVEGYFPKTMLTAEAILQEEEKEEGSLILDISEDSAQLVLWKEGHLVDSRVIVGGSRALAEQISNEWGISIHDAFRVQQEYGSLGSGDFSDELIPLVERNGKGNHAIKRADFQAKYVGYFKNWTAALLEQAEAFCKENRIFYPHLVFSGEIVQTDGFIEFLAQHFSRTARIGSSRKVDAVGELLHDQSLAPVFGMLRWISQEMPDQKKFAQPKGFIRKTIATAKDWFLAYF